MSEQGIQLHPTLGVNARLTVCWQCGEAGQDLMLLGIRNFKDICSNCGTVHYGGANKEGFQRKCAKCECYGPFNREMLTEFEKIPAGLCKKCQDEKDMHDSIVKAGGVYFRCKECGKHGVIKAESGLSKAVREHSGVAAPMPVGIEFKECKEHNCD